MNQLANSNITSHTLQVNLTAIESTEPISDVPCGTCTFCCQILAPYLTREEISSGIYPLSIGKLKNGDPVITLFKNSHGGCGMFINGKCSIYEKRPLACRQFDCRKGHHEKTNDIAYAKFGVNPK
jgi:Fe-S-cluster containining protein